MKINQVSEVQLTYKSKVKAEDRIRIRSSQDAFSVFWDYFDKETMEHIEEVFLLLLNRSNRTIGIVSISKGGTAGSIIDVKVVLQYAIKSNAHSIILCHNHPSGNLQPSEADLKITKKVAEACKQLDIQLFDHLILTSPGEYFSILDSLGI